MPAILLAIPVFNEIKYVEKVVAEVCKYTEHILVIDDGGTDGASTVLKQSSVCQALQLQLFRKWGIDK